MSSPDQQQGAPERQRLTDPELSALIRAGEIDSVIDKLSDQELRRVGVLGDKIKRELQGKLRPGELKAGMYDSQEELIRRLGDNVEPEMPSAPPSVLNKIPGAKYVLGVGEDVEIPSVFGPGSKTGEFFGGLEFPAARNAFDTIGRKAKSAAEQAGDTGSILGRIKHTGLQSAYWAVGQSAKTATQIRRKVAGFASDLWGINAPRDTGDADPLMAQSFGTLQRMDMRFRDMEMTEILSIARKGDDPMLTDELFREEILSRQGWSQEEIIAMHDAVTRINELAFAPQNANAASKAMRFLRTAGSAVGGGVLDFLSDVEEAATFARRMPYMTDSMTNPPELAPDNQVVQIFRAVEWYGRAHMPNSPENVILGDMLYSILGYGAQSYDKFFFDTPKQVQENFTDFAFNLAGIAAAPFSAANLAGRVGRTIDKGMDAAKALKGKIAASATARADNVITASASVADADPVIRPIVIEVFEDYGIQLGQETQRAMNAGEFPLANKYRLLQNRLYDDVDALHARHGDQVPETLKRLESESKAGFAALEKDMQEATAGAHVPRERWTHPVDTGGSIPTVDRRTGRGAVLQEQASQVLFGTPVDQATMIRVQRLVEADTQQGKRLRQVLQEADDTPKGTPPRDPMDVAADIIMGEFGGTISAGSATTAQAGQRAVDVLSRGPSAGESMAARLGRSRLVELVEEATPRSPQRQGAAQRIIREAEGKQPTVRDKRKQKSRDKAADLLSEQLAATARAAGIPEEDIAAAAKAAKERQQAGKISAELAGRMGVSTAGALMFGHVEDPETGEIRWSLPQGVAGFFASNLYWNAWARRYKIGGVKPQGTVDFEQSAMDIVDGVLKLGRLDGAQDLRKGMQWKLPAGAALAAGGLTLQDPESGELQPGTAALAALTGGGTTSAFMRGAAHFGHGVPVNLGQLARRGTEKGAMTLDELEQVRGKLRKQQGTQARVNRLISEFEGQGTGVFSAMGRLLRRSDDIRLSEDDRWAVAMYAANEIGINAVPEKARWMAVEARQIGNEIISDLIDSGLAGKNKDALVNVLNEGLSVKLLMALDKNNKDFRVGRLVQDRQIGFHRLRQPSFWANLDEKQLDPQTLRDMKDVSKNFVGAFGKPGVMTSADVTMMGITQDMAAMPKVTLADDIVDRLGDKPGNRIFRAESTGKQTDMAEVGGRMYRRMPNEKKYGYLAGKFVAEEHAKNVLGFYEMAGLAGQLVQGGLQLFKFGAVAVNPASAVRDFVGTVMMLDTAGVDLWDMKHFANAWSDFGKHTSKRWEDYFRAGGTGGTYLSAEAGRVFEGVVGLDRSSGNTQKALQNFYRNHKDKSVITALGKGVIQDALSYASKPFAAVAEFRDQQEQFMRYYAARWAMDKKGMDLAEAIRWSRLYVPDYSEANDLVKFVSRSGLGSPFIMYNYKAIPRQLEAQLAAGGAKRFWKFWKYPLALSVYNEVMDQQSGRVPGDKNSMFESMKRVAMNTFRLNLGKAPSPENDFFFKRFAPDHLGPWSININNPGDMFGRSAAIGMQYVAPMAFRSEPKGLITRNLMNFGIDVPGYMDPSGPWISLLGAALSNGRDPDSGRQIWGGGGGWSDNAMTTARWMVSKFSPRFTPGIGFTAQQIESEFEAPGNVRNIGLRNRATRLVSAFNTTLYDPAFMITRATKKAQSEAIKTRQKIEEALDAGAKEGDPRIQKLLAEFNRRVEKMNYLADLRYNQFPKASVFEEALMERKGDIREQFAGIAFEEFE